MLPDTVEQSSMVLTLPKHEFPSDSISSLINSGSELSFKVDNFLGDNFLFITKFFEIEQRSLNEKESTLHFFCTNVDKYIPEHDVYDGGYRA